MIVPLWQAWREQKDRTGFFIITENASNPLVLDKILINKAEDTESLRPLFKEVKYLGE